MNEKLRLVIPFLKASPLRTLLIAAGVLVAIGVIVHLVGGTPAHPGVPTT